MGVGLASNPETPVHRHEPFLRAFDVHLVMSVHPGFSGQAFLPRSLEKTRWLRQRLGSEARLEMDGGITATTASDCVRAGADVLVSASALFGGGGIQANAAALHRAASVGYDAAHV